LSTPSDYSGHSGPATKCVLKWLALQDLARHRAQSIRRAKLVLHAIAFLLSLCMPLAPFISDALNAIGIPSDPVHVTGLLGFTVIAIEVVAHFRGDRAQSLNVLSRLSLAWALPAAALQLDTSEFQWEALLGRTSPDVLRSEIEREIAKPDSTDRFDHWWRTQRVAGEGRLRAMLLENIWWTVAILEASETRRVVVSRIVWFTLLVVLVTGIMIAPVDTRRLTETVLTPILAFLLATLGSGILMSGQEGLAEVASLKTALRGSDHWGANHAAATWSIFASYLALTASLPPISSKLYAERRDELDRQTSDASLEAWLQARH
jgi:hypothetical protein